MNYDEARQVRPDNGTPDAGKWRYTSMNDGRVWPIGYCGRYRPCPACGGMSMENAVARVPLLERADAPQCPKCNDTGAIEVGECAGHDTAGEACQHYVEYMLDYRLRLDGQHGQASPCVVCTEWTDRVASVGASFSLALCDPHRTRAQVEDRYRARYTGVFASAHS